MKKIFTLSMLLLLAVAGFSQMRYFYAPLSGTNEVPSNSSTANGMVLVKYNLSTRLIEISGNYNGLAATITGSHIHTGAAGANGAVIIQLTNTGGNTGTVTQTATLTAGQETDLLAGNLYANIHSGTFTGGEIRAQLLATTAGQTEFVNARIQGAQEVPPNGSTASGVANAIVDKTTNKVYVTGSFSGLTSAATAAHIHVGAVGANGGVVLGLVVTSATSGTIHGEGTLTASQINSIATGGAYVNIHNSTFAGGEIRGQLNSFGTQEFFGGRFSGNNENPSNSSPATGTVIAKYNMATRELEIVGDYQGLSANISASHIHLGSAAINGGVIFNLTNTGGTFGMLTATATLTAVQEDSLLNNKLYANVHSSSFPGGEIRTQLFKTASGSTQYFKNNINGAQEVPANASPATGNVTVIADRVTGQTYVTGSFTNLTNNISGSHIHRGQTGVNGPVIINLTNTGNTSGNFSGSQILSAALVDSLTNGFAYVNLHSAPSFTGGEIRGQLGNLVLPVKLAYFNGYKQNDQVVLNWQTLSELNEKHYEVEQQNTTNNTWVKRTTVAAISGSTSNTYKANDVPVDFNQTFVNYRLKMIDKDGSFEYSPVVKINFNKKAATVSIVGNSVKNVLNYRLSSNSNNSKATVNIIDQNGRTLHREVVGVSANHSIDIAELANGVYVLLVQIDGEQVVNRFIKQ